MDKDFANNVANLCYSKFARLPRTGKPQANKEWTLLAAILITRSDAKEDDNLNIVSLATGSKCIGASKLSPNGDIVHDSHAEILARRAFLKYLYHEVECLHKHGRSQIFQWNKDKLLCKLMPGIKFHLFTSHTPCGDASIFSKDLDSSGGGDEESSSAMSKGQKRELQTDLSECFPNKSKKCEAENCFETSLLHVPKSTDDCDEFSEMTAIKNNGNLEEPSEEKVDIYRTGAKCVAGGIQDLHGKGSDYHVVGALRIKPGRGDRTLSMSCSDKIARWNICGLQGALLSHFLASPIYLSTIIIGKCPYSNSALYRAIVERLQRVEALPQCYNKAKPMMLQSDNIFEHGKNVLLKETNGKIVPCPSSVVWCNVPQNSVDILVNGYRQGITKRDLQRKDASVSICKRELFRKFLGIIENLPSDKTPPTLKEKKLKTYSDYKTAAESYQKAWKALLLVFKDWSTKPPFTRNFSLSDHS